MGKVTALERLDVTSWAHLALSRVALRGVETTVITQNIDGLHQRAGPAADRVIELHAARSGARVVLIHREPTPYDAIADAVIPEPIGAVVPELVDQLLAARAS
jgi:NAD-dependent SIR2 family protein deacetylase